MHPIARTAVSLAAGIAVVFLIDRFIWPGTLVPGIIGVVCAVVVLNLPAFRSPPRP
jgi:membrane-bound ClpP family serine protease